MKSAPLPLGEHGSLSFQRGSRCGPWSSGRRMGLREAAGAIGRHPQKDQTKARRASRARGDGRARSAVMAMSSSPSPSALSSANRTSHRRANPSSRAGATSATSATRSSASTKSTTPISLAHVSAPSRFLRSIARRNLARGWPWAVMHSVPGPESRVACGAYPSVQAPQPRGSPAGRRIRKNGAG